MKLAREMTDQELAKARDHAEAMLDDERRRRGTSSLRSDHELIRERADDLYIIASEIDRRNKKRLTGKIADAAGSFSMILAAPVGLNILAYGFGG